MGEKAYKSIKALLLMAFILASYNSQAIEDNSSIRSTENPGLEPSEPKTGISTKTIQTKPIKKSKSQSSSLGMFKLLIPNSLK